MCFFIVFLAVFIIFGNGMNEKSAGVFITLGVFFALCFIDYLQVISMH